MGFAFLDVAIGMTFLFLLLSLICSAINELFAALLHTRASFLEKGIARLLGDEAFVTRLYEHPLIHCLFADVRPFFKRIGWDRPAYIPPRNFALALMDTAAPSTGARDSLTPQADSVNPAVPAGASAPRTAADLLAALKDANGTTPDTLRKGMICLVEAAGQDAARARQNIEDWYNSTMDSVSGVYKRRTQYTIFLIGIFVTIGVNADSVAIFRRLSADKNLASAVAASAEAYVSANRPGDSTTEARVKLNENLETLDKLDLPLGWDGSSKACTPPSWRGWMGLPGWCGASGPLLATHWLGWLLTAFAVSFGAPFWFDLLNRFMVVRSTVKPKEKSPEEGSKD
jgi:hypothetical protein